MVLVVVVGEGGRGGRRAGGNKGSRKRRKLHNKENMSNGRQIYRKGGEREMWKIKCCKGRTCHWLSECACVYVCESAYSTNTAT